MILIHPLAAARSVLKQEKLTAAPHGAKPAASRSSVSTDDNQVVHWAVEARRGRETRDGCRQWKPDPRQVHAVPAEAAIQGNGANQHPRKVQSETRRRPRETIRRRKTFPRAALGQADPLPTPSAPLSPRSLAVSPPTVGRARRTPAAGAAGPSGRASAT